MKQRKSLVVSAAVVLGMAVAAVAYGVAPVAPTPGESVSGTASSGGDADALAKEKAALQAQRNRAKKPGADGGSLLSDRPVVKPGAGKKKAPPAAGEAVTAVVTTEKPKWDELAKIADTFKVAGGMNVAAWAAEPQLANPVAFCADERGRWYVVEDFRFDDGGPDGGVYDIRGHMEYLDDDLSCRTVEDRLKLATRMEHGNLARLTKDPDRIRVVEDTDGDGKADKATIFADGFKDAMDGVAAGVLVRGKDVYFTDIPNVWLLRDTKGTGVADFRESLSYGYGVRYNFLGHDLHGLTWGPDGRLYYSMADRGLHVKTKEGKVLDVPDTGSVLRCEPDGSNLEVFATGLRNPQGLVFDKYGNLFTGDNNCDNGDFARWCYIVEGGDSGWRVGYQHMKRPASTGPWLAENLWMTAEKNTGEYNLPPLGYVASGPSGNAYYPGTGLPEKYEDHFFQTDFMAGPSSCVHSFALKPKGAEFELTDKGKIITGPLTSDVKFGPDGGLYVLDWAGNGYPKANRGRIWRVWDDKVQASPVVKEVRGLIREGMANRSDAELGKLLNHVDLRVRQNAQFELARRGTKSAPVFVDALNQKDKGHQLARVHAIWGLGQVARVNKAPAVLNAVFPALSDADDEIRFQAARALGEAGAAGARDAFTKLLTDASPRVRFAAAMGLNKVGDGACVQPVLAMLAAAEDKDPYLRHAGAMALAGIAAREKDGVAALTSAEAGKSLAGRMGILEALRRLKRPEVATFLNAVEPSLRLEAARAINDVPIEAAMPELAAVLTRKDAAKLAEPLAIRALNANYRLGKAENASAIAAYAGNGAAPEDMRIEGMMMLGDWAKPRRLDKVVGVYRPLPERDGGIAGDAAKGMIRDVLLGGGEKPGAEEVRVAAIELLKKLTPGETDVLYRVVTEKSAAATPAVGAAALATMAELNAPKTDEAVEVALRQSSGAAREQAIKLLARRKDAAPRLSKLLETGSTADQQAVFAALGNLDGNAAAEQVLAAQLDKLVKTPDAVKPELVLDMLEAGGRWKNDAAVSGEVKAYEKERDARAKKDPLAKYRDTLAGGDAALGKKIFMERTDVSCLRCHKVNGQGAGVAGPDLGTVGSRHDRPYILKSIVDPNADIAPGFESVIVKMKQGKSYGGVVKVDGDSELVLDDGAGAVIHAEKKEIETRSKGMSAMPPDISKTLSRRDLRNLVEYLAGLKQPATGPGGTPVATPGSGGNPGPQSAAH